MTDRIWQGPVEPLIHDGRGETMQQKKPENPPAFPTVQTGPSKVIMLPTVALTLWDYYAAHALGMITEESSQPSDLARWAAETADAMLLEREKRGIG